MGQLSSLTLVMQERVPVQLPQYFAKFFSGGSHVALCRADETNGRRPSVVPVSGRKSRRLPATSMKTVVRRCGNGCSDELNFAHEASDE